jgi:MFS family permease
MSSETMADGQVLNAPLAPRPLTDSIRWRILAYLSALIFMIGFGAPQLALIDLPISFFLKNKLHLTASQVAQFRLMTAIPLYLSFLFGFARDTWNPFGMRDRGFLVLFGSITAAIYVGLAFTPVSYMSLLLGVIMLTCSFLFVAGAQQGLTSAIGQQHVMSGQVSAVWNVVASLPGLCAFLLGGILSDMLEGKSADGAARILFLTGAAVMVCIALFGLWKPRTVYANIHGERPPSARRIDDFVRLLRHWPVYPALLIWMLWNFAPGSQTPLQFYLQNTLHATDAQWGDWNAFFTAGFVPMFMVYGVLCRRFSLRTLLWVGTLIGVPQMIPLAFIHTVSQSLIAAGAIGLMGGVCSAAYYDLLIRSCPRGLQGTVLMMATGLYWVGSRGGDILGTFLYDRFGGFNVCVIAITIVYALILPVILLIPRSLIETADGEVPEGGYGGD